MGDELLLRVKRLDPDLPLPSYAYPGDAGLDLCSTIDLTLEPGERAAVPTGIAIALPDGYAGFVLPRSGLAMKNGLSLVNAPGLIDSRYRGEIIAIVINLDSETPFAISRGDRIAQLVIQAVPVVTIQESDSLGDTERGSQGFGSSGV